jgi:hypothetical protein
MLKVVRSCFTIFKITLGRGYGSALQLPGLTLSDITGITLIDGFRDMAFLVSNIRYIAPQHEADHKLRPIHSSCIVTVIVLPEDKQVTVR